MRPTKFGVNRPLAQEKKWKIDFQDGDHGGHLGFPIGTILATFDLQVTPMLPTKFRVNWHFGLEEAKNRFSRWPPWRPSWIKDRQKFSFFLIYKSPQCFLPGLESIGFWVQEKKRKIDFQDGCHLEIPIGMILAIFDLRVTPMLPTRFGFNWLLGSEEAKNRFSRWRPWQPSWISDRHDFSYFWSTSHPNASY